MQVELYLPNKESEDVVLRKSDRMYRETSYKITSYDRGYSLITDETRLYAYIPPRQTQTYEEFSSDWAEDDQVDAVPAIEGTLVGFFWNPNIEKWEVCTRNGVGCEYSFANGNNRRLNFRQMIVQALQSNLFDIEGHQTKYFNDLDDVSQLDVLSKNMCYICILNHSENHIVYSAEEVASLTLVGIYEIAGCSVAEIPEDSAEWSVGYRVFLSNRSNNDAKETVQTSQELLKKFQDRTEPLNISAADLAVKNSPYHPPAWIFKNRRTGHVSEIVNPYYEAAKEKRNMQPNMRFHLLDLMKNGSVASYLETFPRYRSLYLELKSEYDAFIGSIYDVYVHFYILKIRDETQKYPKKFFVHAAKIHHEIYVPSLNQGRRKKITVEVVRKYLESLSSTKLFYYLTSSHVGKTPYP